MSDPAGRNTSASVRAKLLNLARSSGRDFQELVIRYTVERFLARLIRSVHRERFVLKGAMLYVTWKLDDRRTTMDLDLLGYGDPAPDQLSRVVREICAVEIEDDGLAFDGESTQAELIREDSIYNGVRVIVRVQLGVMPIRLQIDVGFGDVITPEPILSEFPPLLAGPGPTVQAYCPETVIAEKFNAMVELGMANSRMKDYYDIWMLSQSFTFEGRVLGEAIDRTFAKRQSELPANRPIGLSDEFAINASKALQWKGFIRKRKGKQAPPELALIVTILRNFLMPVVSSLTHAAPIPSVWSPGVGWQAGETAREQPERSTSA